MLLTAPTFGGEVMARLPDGRVAFVPRALPDEAGLVRVLEERKDYARAELFELHRPHAERVDPPCPYYRAGCGGCSWQHAAYPLQLQLKRQIVLDQLVRIGRFGPEVAELVRPPIGMLDPWHYRNQARFTVGRKFGELCFTFRSSHRLLRIDACLIVHPTINTTLTHLQGRLAGTDRRIHQLVIRVGANTGDLLIAPALPEVAELPSGQPCLEEELLGRRFRLHPSSFFQVNTRRERRPPPSAIRRAALPLPADGLSQAEILALLVLDRLELSGHERVVDAYSGVGTFALLMAPLAAEVIGVEEARVAVRDALANAEGVANVRFLEAKTEAALPELAADDHPPDAVVLDPARPGAHPAVLQALLAARVPRVVYVSCDPSTLARDLRLLVDGGYRLDEVQPVDMFPQTYHIENVATLTR